MMLNDTILDKAHNAIDQNETIVFVGENLEFLIAEADTYIHKPGSMPTYFTHNDKRYVIYTQPDKRPD